MAAAMTDETRETLTRQLEYSESYAESAREHVAWLSASLARKMVHHARLAAALRDVLTPRTCGTCRHSVEHRRWNDGGVFLTCEHLGSLACCNKVRPDDGCIRGWQAREGEGGTR